MLDGHFGVGSARDFLAGAFDEAQVDEFTESQGLSFSREAVEGVALAAHDQPLQPELGIGGDVATLRLWFFLAQAGVS